MTDSLEIAKVIAQKAKTKKIIPIFLGGESVEDAKEYFKKSKMVYFKTLQEVSSFL